MDGKPLYEYARKGLALPRPIAARNVTVYSLELVQWLGTNHDFTHPTESFSADERSALEKTLQSVDKDAQIKDEPETAPAAAEEKPTAFVLKMKVSGGTYVRSIVHDLAHALDSSGHVVTLTRSRQGPFILGKEAEEDNDALCVPWEVFSEALKDLGETNEDGWLSWEREVIERLHLVD